MSTTPEPVRKSAALQVFAVTLISFLALGFDWGIELTLAANGLAVAAVQLANAFWLRDAVAPVEGLHDRLAALGQHPAHNG
jgi:hypothetical protein